MNASAQNQGQSPQGNAISGKGRAGDSIVSVMSTGSEKGVGYYPGSTVHKGAGKTKGGKGGKKSRWHKVAQANAAQGSVISVDTMGSVSPYQRVGEDKLQSVYA